MASVFDATPRLLIDLRLVHLTPGVIPADVLYGHGEPKPLKFPQLRGRYRFHVDKHEVTLPFVVDTGLGVTVIKHEDWQQEHRRKSVEWFRQPDEVLGEDGLPTIPYRLSGIAGVTMEVFFGTVNLVIQRQGHVRDPLEISVIAAFSLDDHVRQTRLGLDRSWFTRAGLCLNGQNESVHLVQL